ncbi:hypothetical protein [Rufibacter roseolus]|uniref:hypothetical protein n=1 Tax=Rufibacter roseolus TaxID=2817375 RepID=UPI001B30DE1F|nr:hypothetical protein [Rufibacter roseolus]
MENSISIKLGPPEYGWLPIDFRFADFHLDFAASDVLNDPIEELYEVVTKLKDNELKRIIFWLEPAAYFFDFKRNGEIITLTIIEKDDLNIESSKESTLILISGNYKEIIAPFRTELKRFSLQVYEENHWPYKLETNKINDL